MIDISVKNLVKSFEVGSNLLDGLSFEVNDGERVGILGRNGCGKTTLFRILVGEIGYDEGEIMVAPGKRMGLMSQIPVYPPDYTTEDVLKQFSYLPKEKAYPSHAAPARPAPRRYGRRALGDLRRAAR